MEKKRGEDKRIIRRMEEKRSTSNKSETRRGKEKG